MSERRVKKPIRLKRGRPMPRKWLEGRVADLVRRVTELDAQGRAHVQQLEEQRAAYATQYREHQAQLQRLRGSLRVAAMDARRAYEQLEHLARSL